MLSFQRTLLGLIVNIFLNYFLIPEFGSIGAAYATIFSYAAAGLFYDFFNFKTRKMFHMKIKSFNIFRIIINKK
jgi:Na+-driven multidrug efflux pump